MTHQALSTRATKRRARITRENILETASGLLQEHGAQGVSIRKIAALIPCAPPSIYYYFENKESILDALVAGPLDDLIERLQRVADSDPSTLRLLTEYADFWLEHRRQMSLLFLPGHWGQQSIFQHPKYQQVEQMIAEVLAGDKLRAEGYLGLVNGLLFKVQNAHLSGDNASDLVAQTLRRLL